MNNSISKFSKSITEAYTCINEKKQDLQKLYMKFKPWSSPGPLKAIGYEIQNKDMNQYTISTIKTRDGGYVLKAANDKAKIYKFVGKTQDIVFSDPEEAGKFEFMLMNGGLNESSDDGVDKSKPFGVFRSGGSIGPKKNDYVPGKGTLVRTFDTKDEAKNYKKRIFSLLSKGEKQYYKIKYVIVPMTSNILKQLSENSESNKINESNTIDVSKQIKKTEDKFARDMDILVTKIFKGANISAPTRQGARTEYIFIKNIKTAEYEGDYWVKVYDPMLRQSFSIDTREPIEFYTSPEFDALENE